MSPCLAARSLGYRPVWAMGSASAIEAFPVLAGISRTEPKPVPAALGQGVAP